MPQFSVDFSSFTDGIAGGGTGDNVLIAGGLTFTITAQGNWTANFDNGRFNFQEDAAFASELFSISITSSAGGKLHFNSYQISVNTAPEILAGWSGAAYLRTGNSTTFLPDDNIGGGPHNYSDTASPTATTVELFEQYIPDTTTSTRVALWLDNINVATLLPPVIDANGVASGNSNTATFTEDGGAVRIVASDATLSEDGQVTGLTLTLGATPNGASESIAYNDALNGGTSLASLGLVGSYNAATRTFTVSGTASDAVYEGVLRAMEYNNTSQSPNTTARTITIRATDAEGETGLASSTITVNAVNDAPQVTAPASIAVTEDVATALTGISFSDVDAGASPVTVELSVPSGSLAATSGSNVSVSGSGTGSLSVAGTIADINAFIAASNVTYTTAPNATADVQLTASINDGGNSGSGSALSDATVTLDVTAVNDAPVNEIATPQTTRPDTPLVFSSGNGNLISVNDVDADGGDLNVTLTATSGLITLGGTTGLTFLSGNGNANGSMSFSGTIADINNALSGLSFLPTLGYSGLAGIQMVTSDQGNTGSGGAHSDVDTVSITVETVAPKVTDVSSSAANGSYKVGDTITLLITFDQIVTVDTISGTPTLLLKTGSTDRVATYQAGSGSTALAFTYTVQAGDVSADLDYVSTSAFALGGGTIKAAGGDDAVLTLPIPGTTGSLGANKAIVIDGVPPAIPTLELSLDSGQSNSDRITNDGAVSVAGIEMGASWQYSFDGGANWTIGSGTSFVLSEGEYAAGVVQVRQQDAAGNLSAVGSLSATTVDATAPALATASVNGATLVLTFSESLDTTNVPGLNAFTVTVGGSTVTTSAIAVNAAAGTVTLTLASAVSAGQVVAISYSDPSAADDVNALQDAAGNDAASIVYAAVTNSTPAPGPGPDPNPPEPDPTPVPGEEGRNTFEDAPGPQLFIGGDDLDRVVFSQPRSAYSIETGPDGLPSKIIGPGGTDSFENIERIEFSDGVLAFDIGGNAGQSYRLYQAAFGRDPDLEGLSYWIKHLDDGKSDLDAIADSFLNSPEFIRLYGTEETVTDAEFVALLYVNGLGREHDEEGFDYWVGKLSTDQTNRADLLAFFSESVENQTGTAAETAGGIWYV